MDSDDDFLIADDEDFDDGSDDGLILPAKTSGGTPASNSGAPASSVASSAHSTNATQAYQTDPGNQQAQSATRTGGEANSSLGGTTPPSTASPSLVVAPKPQTIVAPTTPVKQAPAQSAAPASPSTADVLRGLQEGGNTLWKKLGDFFQLPAPVVTAPVAAPQPVAQKPSAQSEAHEAEEFFQRTYSKFLDALANADSMTFPVLDDFINDFNGQESLRFDGSDLIEKQERDYFGLRERRLAKLEAAIAEGKDADDVSDEEALAGILEQEVSRDKAVSDGEYQTSVLREHQSSRGQMFQNIVFCSSALFKKLLLWDGATERESNLVAECIEEYLIPHIQKKLYCPDRWTDWRFAQLVGSSQFLQPTALEIATPIDANLINRCGALLTEVNFLPTPRKKLQAIALACRYIVNYLSEHPINVANARAAELARLTAEADAKASAAVANSNSSPPSFQSLHDATSPLPSDSNHGSPSNTASSPTDDASLNRDGAQTNSGAHAAGTFAPPPTPVLNPSPSPPSNSNPSEQGNSNTSALPPSSSSQASNNAANVPSTNTSVLNGLTKTDEFLPVLIYILIQTNPPNLLSNVAYLVTCRSSSDSMLSDEGYFFAHVAIAVHFLCKLKESKNASKVGLEGGVILHEPEWMPMVLDKEARLLHLLPSLNAARAANDIIEYKSTIRRLVLDIMRKNERKRQDKAHLANLLSQHAPISYSQDQLSQFQKEPTTFFADHRYWNSSPEDFKTPSSVAHLLAEYKKLLFNEYHRQVESKRN